MFHSSPLHFYVTLDSVVRTHTHTSSVAKGARTLTCFPGQQVWKSHNKSHAFAFMFSQTALADGLVLVLVALSCPWSVRYNMSSSVRLSSVCLWSVTLVHPTQAIEIFGNVSTPFGTLAICDPSVNILRRFVPGEPLRRGVKPKRGRKM